MMLTGAAKKRLAAVVLLALPLMLWPAQRAKGEIQKTATICSTGICFYWWPKLPAVKGWHHDKAMSFRYSINAQAPDGSTFADAVAVIYAKANYKPREPQIKTLRMLIRNDQADFRKNEPGVVISKIGSLKTADGRVLETYTFFPKKDGNWEEVAYGEEGDFFVVFTLSSRTRSGFDKTLPAYQEFISRYK